MTITVIKTITNIKTLQSQSLKYYSATGKTGNPPIGQSSSSCKAEK